MPCHQVTRSYTGPRSGSLLRSEDSLAMEGTPEWVTAKRLHSPGGSSVPVAMRLQFPRGITAAAFTQAEPHSYRLAKFSKFRFFEHPPVRQSTQEPSHHCCSQAVQRGLLSREMRTPSYNGSRRGNTSPPNPDWGTYWSQLFAVRNPYSCRYPPPCKCFFCASLEATPPTSSALHRRSSPSLSCCRQLECIHHPAY